ncbi:Nucleotide-binding alpha-beta plait [Penicillium verhagenii]|uniref:Nucleotide-binding alpha-beta plait n=1 Tax=Penicillium verhagenii TaxID=1562060 RepID=UPI0025451001|nr:Nucleotide-binding alpha-beta plait [Penicillium verhagenii]KAJ5934098.1 Nucleotide-binding alpha-beta plait [Penicillium verhagenii]
MPYLGREKGRSSRSRRSDDEFVVFLQGIPAHCRWQELKDLVRQTAQHIRQAVVYDDSHGFPTGLGQIIVKNEDEAWRTYHRLSTNGWEGQSLVVTLARTNAPTKAIAGPTRSPPAMIQSSIPGHSTPPRPGSVAMPPSPISPESTQSPSTTFSYPCDYGHLMSPMSMNSHQFFPMMPDPHSQPIQCFPPSPMMHCTTFDPPAWNMMPMYPIYPMSPIPQLPESTDNVYSLPHPRQPWAKDSATILTPDLAQRAVDIKNLHTMTTAFDLETLLQGVGIVEQCNVSVTYDAKLSQTQAHGSAIMHNVEQARRAVTMLNNMMFMGSRICVEMDTRPTVTRSGSWDGSMGPSDPDLLELTSRMMGSKSAKARQETSSKDVELFRPLVVDGSGQSSSLEVLSTSAPV